MSKGRVDAPFVFPLPPGVENIYELVVVASMRARQLNRFPHLRDAEEPAPLVDQAIREAFEGSVGFHAIEPGEEDGGEAMEE